MSIFMKLGTKADPLKIRGNGRGGGGDKKMGGEKGEGVIR